MQFKGFFAIFLATAFTSCSTIRPWPSDKFPFSLQIVPEKTLMRVGESVSVRFILKNTDARSIKACYGTPWHYTILANHFPLESQENIKTGNIHGRGWVVDHPGCIEKPFYLRPNETKEWFETLTILDVKYNKAKLAASIALVDPNDCHEVHGCQQRSVYTDWSDIEICQ